MTHQIFEPLNRSLGKINFTHIETFILGSFAGCFCRRKVGRRNIIHSSACGFETYSFTIQLHRPKVRHTQIGTMVTEEQEIKIQVHDKLVESGEFER